jgi:putative transposase
MYGYSRQAYYKRVQVEQRRAEQARVVLDHVRQVRFRQSRVGTRKLHQSLLDHGIPIGRDRLFGLLRERDLLVKRRRSRHRTTWSYHRFKKYPNLIKGRPIQQAGEVLISDITYIDTAEGTCYLSLVSDYRSRKILGYCLYDTLETEGPLAALSMALPSLPGKVRTIHHSDRGVQYCSDDYVELLERHGIAISMTEEDHVYENAVAERINGILKDEFLLGERLMSKNLAHQMVTEAISIYNEERLHTSLGYLTPAVVYAA